MPFFDRNILNSLLTKHGPLSVTRASGIQNWENNMQDSSITLIDVNELEGYASIHLEWESMMTRIILRSNGLAKTIWSLTQGHDGDFQGWCDRELLASADTAALTAQYHIARNFRKVEILRSNASSRKFLPPKISHWRAEDAKHSVFEPQIQ